MSIEKVRQYFTRFGRENDVMAFEVSSATVELAAAAIGVDGARIAKTLSFYSGNGCILVVTAGDMRIDNAKFKQQFGMKAKMLSGGDVERLTGYVPGGVCPFDNPPGVQKYLDVSLKRFDTIYPACGSGNSGIALDCDELYEYAQADGWIDVCKLPQV